MNNMQILDCTLRDGGYINDWKFGLNVIQDIIGKLIEANIDLIEVGFLRDCDYDVNKTLFNNCKEIANILPKHKRNSQFVAMILHNLYDINKLENYDGKTIEFLRITFHDYDIDEGLQYIAKVQQKGYKVFCNPINIMGYSDKEILELIQKVNIIKPYAFSIVDTFGSMDRKDLIRIYALCAKNLHPDIVIGLHLHENLNSSFALAQDFLNMADLKRRHTCDGSLFGMGRIPGNLCIELLASYLNKEFACNYDVDYLLDAIDDHILKLKKIEEWGYNIAYALSAKHNLHRNYSEFLLNKGKITSKQINQILSQIEPHKKTAFDKNYIEELYLKFQNVNIDDRQSCEILKKILQDANILLLAPGKSLENDKQVIVDYIEKYKPIVISLNFYTDGFKCKFAFFSNNKRFSFFKKELKEGKYIITSNIKDEVGYKQLVFDYYKLAFLNGVLYDNCTIMLLKLLINIGIRKVSIAGFDGFLEECYFDFALNTNASYQNALENNQKIKNRLNSLNKEIDLNFITPSIFEECFKTQGK
ncbi:aldolase catalytic domain-containing protein [Campylobacter jejuni]|uniref:aldolase catalytic domain-containing protein n=1 Tax=Campylobacter TaxID=194 RepID=UPI00025890E2|nr:MULTISPECIES: aldolase catalytic domain-containing protein [Campylobacter]EAI2862151.1 4-hydroxy-2-ketovalerate aldolase [Campylobacter jejuni]EAK1144952.1 4-hydroxy-2-ketovalerate aldolase [Campylobacter jejuni]EAL9887885.1 4-hydroxy-2-ketovalerate aldolase [Campylobacter jejuni]EBD1689521.1 4-hydroxy-2-ketovalerate aldolase [Campylobacter jejuni]ECL3067112.1 4-hydroxy-2-ketovalerate aldolase [Campylobacter jejuni]